MASTAPAPSRWLFGPQVDLLFGCGGAYAALFLLMCVTGDWVSRALPFGLLPLLILFTGTPHYGATLLRVYERGEDRRAYRLFTVWATLAVYAWFGVGVYAVAIGSWLVTLYLTWSPWHYTGQNYGIALMFLHRRGVRVAPTTKRWIYASFLLSYAMAFLGIHAAGQEAAYAPVSLVENSYEFLRLDLPAIVAGPLLLGATLAYALANVAAAMLLRREGRWRDLAPTLALMGTQALWFSIPVVSRGTGALDGWLPFDPDSSEYAFLWVAIGHSVQYLWITTYYAMTSDRDEHRVPYLAKTLMAGCAVWGVPLLLFGPDLLGVRAQDAGLGLLVASAVNVHHFILDGAIWKLRDGRVARILLSSRDAGANAATPIGVRPRWIGRAFRGLVATLGLVYALFTIAGTLELEFGVRRAQDPPDFERMRTAVQRLRWVGRDQPDVRYNLGMQALGEGDSDAARRELRRSLELSESSTGWVALGLVERRARRWDEALVAYQSALALDPDHVGALAGAAAAWQRTGEPERARAALTRALRVAPERDDLRMQLEQLEASGGT
jgi:hypothetical protein